MRTLFGSGVGGVGGVELRVRLLVVTRTLGRGRVLTRCLGQLPSLAQ